MIVRDATPEDFSDLEQIGIAFAKAAGEVEVDSKSLALTLEHLIENGILKVAVNGSVVGCAGALVFPHYWNTNELIAQELFWFVDEEHRGTSAAMRLLVSLENSARALGAKRILMLCLDDLEGEKVAALYGKIGYAPKERTFSKWL